MRFEDRIEIAAPPGAVWRFFEEMEANYLRWHPDHIAFEWRRGRGLAPGNVFYFEERIAGEVLKKETRFTEIEAPRRIVFTMVNPLMRAFIPRMAFLVDPVPGGSRFTGLIELRFVGPLGRASHRRQFDAVRTHMREEGENLRRLVESGQIA